MSSLTTTHEFGHNFGSSHDPSNNSSCAPGANYGNYIMFPKASDGNKAYNHRFSQCSREMIAPVIENKGGCLKVSTGPVCGNGIRETGEECDCGSVAQCSLTNPCCTPPGGKGTDAGCTFMRSEGRLCDPKVSPCCTENCNILNKPLICRQASECTLESTCDGINPHCPSVTTKPDGELCLGGSKVCVGGFCVGSICSKYGLNECHCSLNVDMCKVCCRNATLNQCRPASIYGILNTDGSVLHKLAGQACNNYTGFCSQKQQCVTVTSDSTVSRLQQMFSAGTLLLVQKWFQNYW